jgi:hypothetical protein
MKKRKASDLLFYIIIILSTTMEMFITPASNKPQRSLSYNDLKRKRLQRSASHKKVNEQQQSATNRGRNLS